MEKQPLSLVKRPQPFVSRSLRKTLTGSLSRFVFNVRRHKVLILMVLPAVLLCLLLCYFPMTGIIIAFKTYNYRGGIFGSPWAGLLNFQYFFSSGKALTVTINTLLFNLIFIFLGTFFQIMIAISVAEVNGRYVKKVSQSVMFLPFFISWVVVSGFMYNLFNFDTGVLNGYRELFHLAPVNIYSEPAYWYLILPLLNLWKYTGYGSVIFLAAIMSIGTEYYEVAEIDGANRFQQIRHIMLPLLRPTVIIIVLLALGRILRGDFDMFYQVIGANSALYKATDIIDTFVFRSLVIYNEIGVTSAAAFYQSVVCFILIVVVNAVVKRYQEDSALF